MKVPLAFAIIASSATAIAQQYELVDLYAQYGISEVHAINNRGWMTGLYNVTEALS